MQIEITEKERTALSLLVGLRNKFAKESKTNETYSANDLYKLFSESIEKINKSELRYLDSTIIAMNESSRQDVVISTSGKTRNGMSHLGANQIWGVIDDAIDRSKIKRYDWNKVFGKSLTQEILVLKKQGLSVTETFLALFKDMRVQKFLKDNEKDSGKIIENLRISIHARFGENNTANKVMGEGKSALAIKIGNLTETQIKNAIN